MARSLFRSAIQIPLHSCAPYKYVTLSTTKTEFMIRQPNNSQAGPPVIRTVSSFRSHISDVRQYMIRRRLWLLSLGLFFCIITIAGIVYTCHVFYVDDGGRDWIKLARSVEEPKDKQFGRIFLPMRKVQIFQDDSMTGRLPWVAPNYACGGQLQSCIAFNKPVSTCKDQTRVL
jgi:hypothetical protein